MTTDWLGTGSVSSPQLGGWPDSNKVAPVSTPVSVVFSPILVAAGPVIVMLFVVPTPMIGPCAAPHSLSTTIDRLYTWPVFGTVPVGVVVCGRLIASHPGMLGSSVWTRFCGA